MDSAGKVISDLFEEREMEYLLTQVRVTAKASLGEMEVGDLRFKEMKQGETLELPRWAAEELAELNLADVQEDVFESDAFRALTREKMTGPSQLSELQPSFYLRMKRRLATMKEGLPGGRYRREDYEKLKGACYDLIGRRLSKLLALSSSASIQTVEDRITPEEKVFFASTRSFSEEWRRALLGE